MNLSHRLLRAFSTTCLIVSCLVPLRAQVEVSAPGLPTVGVALSGSLGGGATQIVSADLRRTGELEPVSGATGQYFATGVATDDGITAQLLNKRTGQVIFNQTYNGHGRMAAHQLSDAITQAITGHPGFATSRIAFIVGEGRVKELYASDIDGYSVREITHDGTISASPAISHDGAKIAYSSYKSGYCDTYLIDIGTGSRQRIAFYPGINSGPSFSPDDSSLALTLSKDGNPEIYTISTSGSIENRITRTRGAETSPSWSPDGTRLVYSSDDHGSPQLFVSSSTGVSSMDQLYTGNSYCTKPDWSPDGKLIAFTTRIGGQFQIGVFDLATRTGHLVTTDGGQDPSWTRDSRHLVCSNHGELYLLDTATRKMLPISLSVSGCGEPSVSR